MTTRIDDGIRHAAEARARRRACLRRALSPSLYLAYIRRQRPRLDISTPPAAAMATTRRSAYRLHARPHARPWHDFEAAARRASRFQASFTSAEGQKLYNARHILSPTLSKLATIASADAWRVEAFVAADNTNECTPRADTVSRLPNAPDIVYSCQACYSPRV